MPTVKPNTPYSQAAEPRVEPIDINRDGHLDAADGVVDERDLFRHADDGGRELRVEPVNGPFDDGDAHPPEVADDDYFAAHTGNRAAASDAHGRASTGLRAVEDESAIQQEGFGRPARLASVDEPVPYDVGNGALLAAPAIAWLESRTIRGVLVGAVAFVLGKLGYAIPNETASQLVEWVTTLIYAGATLYAVVARIRATRRVAVPSARPFAALLYCGALLSLVGCATVTPEYVKADRDTYETISPYVRDLADGKLKPEDIDADERQSIEDKLGTWDLRIRGAETGKSSGE